MRRALDTVGVTRRRQRHGRRFDLRAGDDDTEGDRSSERDFAEFGSLQQTIRFHARARYAATHVLRSRHPPSPQKRTQHASNSELFMSMHTTKSAIVPWPALSERDGREDEGEGQGGHRRPGIEAADFVQNFPREIWIFDSLESLAVHLPHATLSDVAQAALSRCEVGQSKGEQRRRGEATPESSLLDHEPSIQHKDKNQQDTTQDLALRALSRVDVRQLRSG